MDVVCFWTEPNGWWSVYARRYVSGSVCESGGIHDAMTLQTVTRAEHPVSGRPDADELTKYIWPETCDHCDYRFTVLDVWQVMNRPQLVRPDTGETYDRDDAPVGAIYRAEWYEPRWRGPDGHALVVVLPNGAGAWCMDGPATDGSVPGWTRTGTPPKLTVKPSIGRPRADGSHWLYHGHLRDGVLVDA